MPVPDASSQPAYRRLASTAVTAGSATPVSVGPSRKPSLEPLGAPPPRPTRLHGFVLQAAWPPAPLGWEHSVAPERPRK